ncbi:HEAT repeat domain-containing protein [Methylobacterium sp. GXS13]|uniref:HEAT repeat domain-containing protein n=1 Tax=Methylobacterium sp. GXS13 TaxID=1730094 RepID=UPI000A60A64E|nr:HEAT repeat domain-containing protein [Methylobacterium sp. GXS13]
MAIEQEIFERTAVPGIERLFVLGSFARPATLYMQQVRALNLIFALNQTRARGSLAVVGAGAGGVTAAAAAAICGWDVTIFDRISNDVLSLAGSETSQRWLHPHIYDWPEEGAEEDDAGLCILNWRAGKADDVIAGLRSQWRKIRSAYNIAERLGVSDLSLSTTGGKHVLAWNGQGSSSNEEGRWGGRTDRRMHVQDFDFVILAVGFGKEEPSTAFPMTKSYWDPDTLGSNRTKAAGPENVLVSGTGDGGLIDVLRLSFSAFRHETVLTTLRERWLGPARFAQLVNDVKDIESRISKLRASGESYEAQMYLSYSKLADALPNPVDAFQVRDDVVPVLTGTGAYPLSLVAAPVNRLLLTLTNAQFIPGGLTSVKGEEGNYLAHFAKSGTRQFATVVIRHGPRPVVEGPFPDIFNRCKPFRATVGTSEDPTRRPMFDEAFDTGLRRAASAAAGPTDVGPLNESVVVVQTDDRSAERAYRNVIAARAINQSEENPLLGPIAPDMRAVDMLRLPTAVVRSGGVELANAIRRETIGRDWLLTGPNLRAIVGPPGSGKSYILNFLASVAAADETLFPVIASLSEFDELPSSDVLGFIFDQAIQKIENCDRVSLGGIFARRLLQGRVIFLLDNLDEMTPQSRERLIKLLTADDSRNHVVVATGNSHDLADQARFSIYQVAPLDSRELSRKFDEVVEGFGGRISGKWLIDALRGLPSSAFGILIGPTFNTIIDAVRSESSQGRAMVDALGNLAFQIWQSERGHKNNANFQNLSEKRGDVDDVPENWIDLAREYNFLLQDIDGELKFSHKLLLECFVGNHLAHFDNTADLIIELMFDTATIETEILPICIGRLAAPSPIFERLRNFPDSLDRALLRLRIRALRYLRSVPSAPINDLTEDLIAILREPDTFPGSALIGFAGSLRGLPSSTGAMIGNALWRAAVLGGSDQQVRTLALMAASALPGAVEAAQSQLQTRDEALRAAAAEALGELRASAAVPDLVRSYLDWPGQMVFEPAVKALAAIGDDAAIEALAGILSSSVYQNLRWQAARALGTIRKLAAIAPLIEALSDTHAIVRAHAAWALGEIGSVNVQGQLRTCLPDLDANVRGNAAEALGKIGAVGATAELRTLLMGDSEFQVRDKAAQAMMILDRNSLLADLKLIVTNPFDPFRRASASLLVELASDEALPVLTIMAYEAESNVKEGVAAALSLIQSRPALQLLIELAGDTSDSVRQEAARSLRNHTEYEAVEKLIDLFSSDPSDEVRANAAEALRALADPRSRLPLEAAVREGGLLSGFAALALGNIGDEESIPVLTIAWRQAEGSRKFIKDWYCSAIGRIGGPRAAASLHSLLIDAVDRSERMGLVRALQQVRSSEATAALIGCLGDADTIIRSMATEILWSKSNRAIIEGMSWALRGNDCGALLEAIKIAPYYANSEITRVMSSHLDGKFDKEVRIALRSIAERESAVKLQLLETKHS